MNPFNLGYYEFPPFYLCFSLVVILAMVLFRIRAESGDPPKMDLSDPYLVAYLRSGENEVLQVAIISLIDRGILVIDERAGRIIRRTKNEPKDINLHPIESEVLKKFSIPRVVADIFKYQESKLQSGLNAYNEKLKLAGLIPDSDIHRARIRRLVITITILGIVAMIKVVKGPYYGTPIRLILVMMVAAMVIAGYCAFPRLTVRGRAALADIKNLYSGLRTQANSFKPGASTAELAMFAAVFGAAALAATSFAFAADLFSKGIGSSSSDSSSNPSSNSSCSSSDDGNRWLNSWNEERNSCGTYSDGCGGSSDEGSSSGSASDG
jgi:uncharacterized protein (TIGR04222 family)